MFTKLGGGKPESAGGEKAPRPIYVPDIDQIKRANERRLQKSLNESLAMIRGDKSAKKKWY
jgi:hypothetical protein